MQLSTPMYNMNEHHAHAIHTTPPPDLPLHGTTVPVIDGTLGPSCSETNQALLLDLADFEAWLRDMGSVPDVSASPWHLPEATTPDMCSSSVPASHTPAHPPPSVSLALSPSALLTPAIPICESPTDSISGSIPPLSSPSIADSPANNAGPRTPTISPIPFDLVRIASMDPEFPDLMALAWTPFGMPYIVTATSSSIIPQTAPSLSQTLPVNVFSTPSLQRRQRRGRTYTTLSTGRPPLTCPDCGSTSLIHTVPY